MQERLDLSSFLHLFGCCHTRRILNHLKCEWINMAGYGQYMLSSTQWLGCAFPISKWLEYQQCIYIHIYIYAYEMYMEYSIYVWLYHSSPCTGILFCPFWEMPRGFLYQPGRSRNMLKIQRWKKNRRNAWWPLSGFQRLEKMWENPHTWGKRKADNDLRMVLFSTCFVAFSMTGSYQWVFVGKSSI